MTIQQTFQQSAFRRGGNRFVRHTGLAAPFVFNNVSTDVSSPGGEATGLLGVGIDTPAELAFANIRYFPDGSERPDFVFNQEQYRSASIMIVGLNYGTGSSRTGAITRPLAAWGVRVYIGESFGPIFLTNAMQYGVLTVELPRPTIDRIADWVRANPGIPMTVDLEREVVEIPGLEPIPFQTEARKRNKLLTAMDDLEEISPHLSAARAKRAEDERERPWVYQFRGPGR
jgi:3-isopropylmalate/(R)-2-methylmalate dehydratase small subunit